jgi:glycosyltransferase involved in cell wall biosynthesis
LASFRNTASSRKPVLLISYYYPPDTQSGAARPHRFAKYLRRLGHPVTILAAGPEADPVTDGDVHRLRGGGIRYPRQDTAAFIERCFRQTLFVHDPGGTWAWRVADYAARWIRNAAEQPVVISTAPPATCHAAGYLLKKRHGVRWIADFRDPMTGNPFRPGRMASFFDRPLERRFFEAADVIIANTDAVEKMWVQRRPDLKHKFHVIWNGFDPEEPLASQPLPPRPQRVLAHIGVIYGDRDPNLLLRSFARLVQSGRVNPASVRLELTGSIDFNLLDAEATQALKERGSFESRESVPRAEAQRLMATADYLLLLDVISDKAGLPKYSSTCASAARLSPARRRVLPSTGFSRRAVCRIRPFIPTCLPSKLMNGCCGHWNRIPIPGRRAPGSARTLMREGRRKRYHE